MPIRILANMVEQHSASGSGHNIILGNVNNNWVYGAQFNRTYNSYTDSVAHDPDLSTVLKEKRLRDVLFVLVVLSQGTTVTVPLVSDVLGRSKTQVHEALCEVHRYVKRDGSRLVLVQDIRRQLEDPEQTGDYIPQYHNRVARWSLAKTRSKYPRATIYAAEWWDYHVTKSQRSPELYQVLQDSLIPRQEYSRRQLPRILHWLRQGTGPEREPAIKTLEEHFKCP